MKKGSPPKKPKPNLEKYIQAHENNLKILADAHNSLADHFNQQNKVNAEAFDAIQKIMENQKEVNSNLIPLIQSLTNENNTLKVKVAKLEHKTRGL